MTTTTYHSDTHRTVHYWGVGVPDENQHEEIILSQRCAHCEKPFEPSELKEIKKCESICKECLENWEEYLKSEKL